MRRSRRRGWLATARFGRPARLPVQHNTVVVGMRVRSAQHRRLRGDRGTVQARIAAPQFVGGGVRAQRQHAANTPAVRIGGRAAAIRTHLGSDADQHAAVGVEQHELEARIAFAAQPWTGRFVPRARAVDHVLGQSAAHMQVAEGGHRGSPQVLRNIRIQVLIPGARRGM